jgi:hypothetical protein
MKPAIKTARTVELRRANRYRLSAPVFFYWAPANGPAQSGQGTTRDINTYGVYVQTDKLPPAGVLVQMDILLPKLAFSGSGVHLTGEGVVLRVERHGSNDSDTPEGGFAASVQFYPEAAELGLYASRRTGELCNTRSCSGRGREDPFA